MLNSADFLVSVFHHCLMVRNNSIGIGHGSETENTRALKPRSGSSMRNQKKKKKGPR